MDTEKLNDPEVKKAINDFNCKLKAESDAFNSQRSIQAAKDEKWRKERNQRKRQNKKLRG